MAWSSRHHPTNRGAVGDHRARGRLARARAAGRSPSPPWRTTSAPTAARPRSRASRGSPASPIHCATPTPLWYLPLILAGFAPGLVAAALVVVIGYQQWIHTELVGRLRWLDPWLNTPSNHRVHHASQGRYLDRNYGGILIVWDRLFGTYAPELEAPRYGLTVPVGSVHPWPVHVAELRRLVRALRATPRWRERWAMLWRGPEWVPPSTIAAER